jgi:hypothetical protein
MKKNRHTSQEIRDAFDKLMNDQKKEKELKNPVNVVRESSNPCPLRNFTS